MHEPTIDQQIADIRRLMDRADHLDRSDQRLAGALIIAVGDLADICERQAAQIRSLEDRLIMWTAH